MVGSVPRCQIRTAARRCAERWCSGRANRKAAGGGSRPCSATQYAHVVSLEEIIENDFNLNIPRYIDTFEAEREIDVKAVQAEINSLEAELVQVKAKMAGYLKELGVDA
jgi:type I restriction-modification system DNA methylase subunit